MSIKCPRCSPAPLAKSRPMLHWEQDRNAYFCPRCSRYFNPEDVEFGYDITKVHKAKKR